MTLFIRLSQTVSSAHWVEEQLYSWFEAVSTVSYLPRLAVVVGNRNRFTPPGTLGEVPICLQFLELGRRLDAEC